MRAPHPITIVVLIVVVLYAVILPIPFIDSSRNDFAIDKLTELGDIQVDSDTIWYVSSGCITEEELFSLHQLAGDYEIALFTEL